MSEVDLPEHFAALPPTVNKEEIYTAVREIIGDLHRNGNKTYPEIARAAANLLARPILPPAAIKVFLEKKTKKINTNNRAFPILYDYIRTAFQDFPESTRAKTLQFWSVLIPNFSGHQEPMNLGTKSLPLEMERSLGIMLKNWLKVSDREVDRLFSKMFGDFSGNYILLRKSAVDPKVFIRSRLLIDQATGPNALPRVQHFHYDRHGVERVSSGMLIPLSTNIYAILEVENGEGLEFIALRNPITWNFKKMMGFMISMNMDRNILSARIFIERESGMWDNISNRFTEDDVQGYAHILTNLKLVDSGTANTISDV